MIKEKLKRNQKELAVWAADCAQHVLPYFEKEYPKDDRPRKAIEACRTWARSEIKVGEARAAALAAHAAAHNADASNNSAACAVARAAGHAAGTAHVAGHASHAANYAVKAAEAAGIFGERKWQYKHLPKRLQLLLGNSKH